MNAYHSMRLAALTLLLSSSSLAGTVYVATNSPADGPGTEWANAFHEIQDALDAAGLGDTVLVTNGVYDKGSYVVSGVTNRVALVRSVSLQSVNGPAVTFIHGAGPLGANAVRCAYLTNGTSMAGFTLANGHTPTSGALRVQSAGGVYLDGGGTVSNCTIRGNSAKFYGGGVFCDAGGTVQGCTVVSNTADDGGGVHFLAGGTLNHCIIRDNMALTSGGGVNCEQVGTVRSCMISGNEAGSFGGGANIYRDVLMENCALLDNKANNGGGVVCLETGMVRNCTISGNESIQAGGGAWLGSNGRLENCIVGGNSAAADGGGVFIHTSGGTIRNCTISGNTCVDDGGGVMCNAGSTIQNTIIHMNAADRYGDNWYTNGAGIAFTYCCTTPTNKLPGGTGCIDVNPKFADPVFHLQSDSPCIDTGTEIAGVTNDLDGSPRPMDGDATGGTNTDIGAYEYARADLDTDGDGLDDWEEVSIHGTAMNSADIDGDGITDPDEITMGFNPRVNNSDALAGYGLYTSNSIYDLSMGTLMGAVISGDMNLDLQLQGCTNLGQGAWTNIGAPVPWSEPADDGKSFFRVWSGQ